MVAEPQEHMNKSGERKGKKRVGGVCRGRSGTKLDPFTPQVSLLPPKNVIGLTRGVAVGSAAQARLCQTRSHQDQTEAKINAIHPPTNEISSIVLYVKRGVGICVCVCVSVHIW